MRLLITYGLPRPYPDILAVSLPLTTPSAHPLARLVSGARKKLVSPSVTQQLGRFIPPSSPKTLKTLLSLGAVIIPFSDEQPGAFTGPFVVKSAQELILAKPSAVLVSPTIQQGNWLMVVDVQLGQEGIKVIGFAHYRQDRGQWQKQHQQAISDHVSSESVLRLVLEHNLTDPCEKVISLILQKLRASLGTPIMASFPLAAESFQPSMYEAEALSLLYILPQNHCSVCPAEVLAKLADTDIASIEKACASLIRQ